MSNPLSNPKKAIIFSVIHLQMRPITAKEISLLTKIPLNTVYHYLKILKKENIIESQTEEINNLLQEKWVITEEFNQKYQEDLFEDWKVNEHIEEPAPVNVARIRKLTAMFNAQVNIYLNSYETKKNFPKAQVTSEKPCKYYYYVVDDDEYKLLLKEMKNIVEKISFPDEPTDPPPKNLVFYGFFPFTL